MHGRVPPMSGGITTLYSIAIRTHCPTLLTPPPLSWLDICLSNLVARQWNTNIYTPQPQTHAIYNWSILHSYASNILYIILCIAISDLHWYLNGRLKYTIYGQSCMANYIHAICSQRGSSG